MSKDLTKKTTTKTAEDMEKERKRMREKVTGIFRFHEVAGGSLPFVYREFKGDPIEKFVLYDGEVYTLPRGVARHLNKNGWYPEYGFCKNDGSTDLKVAAWNGDNIEQRPVRKVRRFSFQSLEFTDIEEADKGIIQIATV